MDNITFADIWQEMLDRWPAWKPTEVEKSDWQAVLKNCNRDYASESLQNMRIEHPRSYPMIDKFGSAFGAVVKANSVKQQPADEPDERAVYDERVKQERLRIYADLRQYSTEDLRTALLAVVDRHAHMRRHKNQPDNPDLWPWALACEVWRELTYDKVAIDE